MGRGARQGRPAVGVSGVWTGDHTWAHAVEINGAGDGAADWRRRSGIGTVCFQAGWGANCCAYYSDWYDTWRDWSGYSYDTVATPYVYSELPNYGYNGVCHQNANRANDRTWVPSVDQAGGIGGSGASTSVWGYCGTANGPWGSRLGCP
jgi:hypothetical protein